MMLKCKGGCGGGRVGKERVGRVVKGLGFRV